MQYSRPTYADFDEWANCVGSDEWSWAKMLPFFQKSEHLETNDHNKSLLATHGIGGAIHTSTTQSQITVENTFLDVCRELAGYSKNEYPVDGIHDDFFAALSTVDRSSRNGTRSYAASGYILPHLGRPNLKILTEANVECVRFSTTMEIPTADGVHFWYSGTRYTATAKREVILSAGTHKTPQILELSGIGDPDILKAYGVISLVSNKSVGEDMQDHTAFVTTFELAPGIFSVDAFADPNIVQPFMEEYQRTGGGPLSSPPSGMGFLSYPSLVSPQELDTTTGAVGSAATLRPLTAFQQQRSITRLKDLRAGAIQILFVPAHIDTDEGRTDQSKFIRPASSGKYHATAITAFQYSLSRGSVHITSADPQLPPAIDPSFLSHPVDIAVLRATMKFLNKVSLSSPLQAKLSPSFSLATKFGLGNQDAEEAYIRSNVGTEHHPIGTAAMGAVVDTKLRVIGVHGLRCVDASIFPVHISGNPMATVYAVAEKAGAMILQATEE